MAATPNELPLVLADLDSLPPLDQLKVTTAPDLRGVIHDIGMRSMGYSGHHFFGSAFIQGRRLCFTTSMSFLVLTQVCKPDRPEKNKTGLDAVQQHSNRPTNEAQARKLREYIIKTACNADKFILPAFTLNYGIGRHEEAPPASLILFVADDASVCWPALLFLPNPRGHGILEVTDGAHRWKVIDEILNKPHRLITPEMRALCRENAADVKIVFERDPVAAHQDFADCGKAKPIQQSLVVTWDIRDQANRRSRDLVNNSLFLRKYVDATAANVNLSAKSRNIWSMSAIKIFVTTVMAEHPDKPKDDNDLSEVEKNNLVENFTRGFEQDDQGMDKFLAAVIKHVPDLRELDTEHPEHSVGQKRDQYGGNVALRAAGMALFARAYCYCLRNEIAYEDMAAKLATLDWHLLTCSREQLTAMFETKQKADKTTNYHDVLMSVTRDLWRPLVLTGPQRYRINSSANEVDPAWKNVVQQLFAEEVREAAE